MPKNIHLILVGISFAILVRAIFVWQDDPSPSSQADRISDHSAEKIPGVHPSKTHPRDVEPKEKNPSTWPMPVVASAEVETKRAEMMAAFEVASKIEDPAAQKAALTRICYHWAGFDPRGAVETAIAWELEEVPGLFENLALQWASTDLTSAREWVGMQPSSDFRSELVMRMGFAMAQDDPPGAADYVIREIQAGPIQAEAAIAVVHQWAMQDRAAAQTWVENTLSGDLQKRALQEINDQLEYSSADPRD